MEVSKWVELRRLQPVTEWLHTKNISDRKYLQKALRSKTGVKLGFARRIAEFAEEKDSLSVGNLLDDIFSTYGADRPDVAIFVKDAIHKMTLGPSDKKKDNVLTKNTEIKIPTVKRSKLPDQRPTSLQALNQTVGIPNQPINANTQVQPTTSGKTPTSNKADENEDGDVLKPDIPNPNPFVLPANNPSESGRYTFDQRDADNTQLQNIRLLSKDVAPEDIAPSEAEQVQNDIMFDMFSHVPDGFGNGATNKLYRMDINHDQKIRFKQPLYEPRAYEGPELGLAPLPNQWKNQMDKSTIETYTMQLARDAYDRIALKSAEGVGSSLPGNDVHVVASSKGLTGPRTSILQKQINNITALYPTKFQIKRKLSDAFFSINDSLIDPVHLPIKKNLARNSLKTSLALQTIHGNDWML